MPPVAGYWHSLLAKHGHVWKAMYKEASKAVHTKLLNSSAPAQHPAALLQYARARVSAKQSLHPIARIRQGQSRWLSTKRRIDAAVRYFSSETCQPTAIPGVRPRVSYKAPALDAIRQFPGRAPFASTLRPNLTGGALGRTAGGYSLGGGKSGPQRYFSHVPAAQAQVVQNVSQAFRAFLLGGQKAQYNGIDPATGRTRYRACTHLQAEAGGMMRNLPKTSLGSYLAFSINPSVTCLTPLQNVPGFSVTDTPHLNADGLLDLLSVDFSRSLKNLAIVLADLKRLSALGDLLITYEAASLRVHFPGCGAGTVERLCAELGIQRGWVVQDEGFDTFAGTEMALLFPFAPSEDGSQADDLFEVQSDTPAAKSRIQWHDMSGESESNGRYSTQSVNGLEFVEAEPLTDELSLVSTDEGYHARSSRESTSLHSPLEYQGVEGIYRFLQECDNIGRKH